MRSFIDKACRKVLGGKELEKEEALRLSRSGDGNIFSLLEAANRIREKFRGDEVDLCAVVNAKSGNCSED